jgi:hypothetical protein
MMRIYCAGTEGFEHNLQTNHEIDPGIRHRLLSHFIVGKSKSGNHLIGEHETRILDSGAFSAWTKKKDVDLQQYIDFALDHLDHFTYIVNLDVIPAEPGQKKIPQEEIDRSAKRGWNNYRRMLRAGIPKEKLIHVFHQGEDMEWLQKFIDEDVSYLGISPANDRTTPEKVWWIDRCMDLICDADGNALVPFHGFAVTSFKLMSRYPWASVDSATWTMTAASGNIIIPQIKRDGTPDFSVPYSITCISDESPNRGKKGAHIESLPKQWKSRFFIPWVEYLQEHYNVEGIDLISDLDLLSSTYRLRAFFNVFYFNALMDNWKPVRFREPNKGLF